MIIEKVPGVKRAMELLQKNGKTISSKRGEANGNEKFFDNLILIAEWDYDNKTLTIFEQETTG